MSEDTPITQALAAGQPFWMTPRGAALNVFVAIAQGGDPVYGGGTTHGPFTAKAFLDGVKALRLTAAAEQHTRDCVDCAFDLEVWLEAPVGTPYETQPLCPIGHQLGAEAAEARRAALSALGVLP